MYPSAKSTPFSSELFMLLPLHKNNPVSQAYLPTPSRSSWKINKNGILSLLLNFFFISLQNAQFVIIKNDYLKKKTVFKQQRRKKDTLLPGEIITCPNILQ